NHTQCTSLGSGRDRRPPTSTLFPYTTLFRSRKPRRKSAPHATSTSLSWRKTRLEERHDGRGLRRPYRRRRVFGPLHAAPAARPRSEEHTSELQSRENLVCRLLLDKTNWTSPC